MANFYPLALHNEWHYKQNDGTTYSNKIIHATGNQFALHNSTANTISIVKTDGHLIITDALEAGNFQPWLTNDLQKGDNWVVKFKANGIDNMLVMTVIAAGINKEVEGKLYNNVVVVEAENKMMMNDSLKSLNFFTQYYYAEGVGLIVTTSSAGDVHALTHYTLH
ncbi:hypothetical protein [Ferruginibacter profundus]